MAEHTIHKRRGRLPSIEVVDLFCGIGGLSYGMKSKGFKILEGFLRFLKALTWMRLVSMPTKQIMKQSLFIKI